MKNKTVNMGRLFFKLLKSNRLLVIIKSKNKPQRQVIKKELFNNFIQEKPQQSYSNLFI